MSRSASSALSASLARRNTFACVNPQIRSPWAMHAIAPVPAQTRTHGKAAEFDGGVPTLDVAAGPPSINRSHGQPSTARPATPSGHPYFFLTTAEVHLQSSTPPPPPRPPT